MSLRDKISAFRGTNQLVESFDPMNDKAEYPDVGKAAAAFKKASQQADELRNAGDEVDQRRLWQLHRAKKDAHALLLGRTMLDFPHLSTDDALHVASRHIKQGSMKPYEHIAVLSDFHGARDHNEQGVTFNSPYRAARAEAFIKSLRFHYPDMSVSMRELPVEGLTIVQFPQANHLAPQLMEPEGSTDEEPAPEEQPVEEPEAQPEEPQQPASEEPPAEGFAPPTFPWRRIF